MIDIIFLGTGSMIPTANRNPSATFLRYGSEGILIDCAEGTQRQFRKAGISTTKITKILISHWHGDHTLGLPGLLQTLVKNNYNKKLEIYGPPGFKEKLCKLLEIFEIFRNEEFKLEINEIKSSKLFSNDFFKLEALTLDHSSKCFGFKFIEKDKLNLDLKYLAKFGLEKDPILKKLKQGIDILWQGKKIKVKNATILKKGKKISFISDTAICENAYKLAENADLLISESTYDDRFKDKAKQYGHLTASQAAEIAVKSNAKELILTHFSQRYKTTRIIKRQAKKIFPKVKCAKDFMIFSL